MIRPTRRGRPRPSGRADVEPGAAQVSGHGTAHVSGQGTAPVPGAGTAPVPGPGTANWRPARWRLRWRPMRRPGGLALRAAGAAAVCVVAVVISGWSPGVVGVLAGVLTWLLATAGRAFARRRSQ